MATLFESLEREETKAITNKEYVERLLSKLGNGADWTYEGEVGDAGGAKAKCSCGHPIRWMFTIRRKDNPKTTAILGSECINHFEYINPALYEALSKSYEALKERLKAEQKAAKEALESAEVQRLQPFATEVAERLTVRVTAIDEKHGRGWLPYDVYNERWALATAITKLTHPKPYKRKKALITSIKKTLMESVRRWFPGEEEQFKERLA